MICSLVLADSAHKNKNRLSLTDGIEIKRCVA